jgi:hypothetical protein
VSPRRATGDPPILSTSIQSSSVDHGNLPHQSAGSDSFQKDFPPFLFFYYLRLPKNEGMLEVCDLLWRPAGRLVRFFGRYSPDKGSCLLMCTDLSLSAIEIIHLCGLRFKIEHSFEQATRMIGAFAYHFWMMDVTPLRHRNGNRLPEAHYTNTTSN